MRFITGLTLIVLLSGCSIQEPTNFVFILADDLGYMDVGAYNPDTFYETPNIDRLAAEGVRFTQGYAAAPVCSPTRASIMTGLYPARMQRRIILELPSLIAYPGTGRATNRCSLQDMNPSCRMRR